MGFEVDLTKLRREIKMLTIHSAARCFINSGHNIFGGYVRDYLLDIPPTDLDVELSRVRDDVERQVTTIILWLLKQGPVHLIKKINGYGKYGSVDFLHYRLVFGAGTEKFQIDLVHGQEKKPDCDINRLVMFKPFGGPLGANISIQAQQGTNLKETLKNLYQKRFKAEKGISEERFQKMIDKGFSPVQ